MFLQSRGVALVVLLVIASAALVSSQNKVYNGRADLNVAKARLAKAKNNKYTFWLAYFRASGLDSFLAKYIQKYPVTILAPTDTAFQAVNIKIKRQMTGQKLVKLLQYNMMLQKSPYAYLQYSSKFSTFPTVLGQIIHKTSIGQSNDAVQYKNVPPSFTNSNGGPTRTTAVDPDVSGSNLLLIIIEGVNAVMLPPRVFQGAGQ